MDAAISPIFYAHSIDQLNEFIENYITEVIKVFPTGVSRVN